MESGHLTEEAMSDRTKIEWSDSTWNPVRGVKGRHWCTRISPGCTNCYSERMNLRFGGQKYQVGADVLRLDLTALQQPLHWKRPRKVFVCSMTDLFHEDMNSLDIAQVWGVMQACPQHTFQVLTKRAELMCVWVNEWVKRGGQVLQNVWLGVSVENQEYADRRIPFLVSTPSVTRFISYEPALGRVTFDGKRGVDWIICGGESGPGARPFDVAWARQAVKECRRNGIACFVKQLGAHIIDRNDAGFDGTEPTSWPDGTETDDWHLDPGRQYQGADARILLSDRKGGDPLEWPEDLRVREWPKVVSQNNAKVQQ